MINTGLLPASVYLGSQVLAHGPREPVMLDQELKNRPHLLLDEDEAPPRRTSCLRCTNPRGSAPKAQTHGTQQTRIK